ncbi:hypothetical protein GA830_13665 [Mesorhizobium sp. NBSH29]|uniref:RHS repeat-associated core domain-containing protein n=1 Tax=Mesorhizobium sp. NBSH29 TaxID=2654249 RepID=UPI0018969B15|nr:RHS repeat-associated core domain-containing protein [Mesorhizobium sp. NBSH29]QPC87674.1 hypothetical protein GA830_13665 [Mesorhizobium sp. NBSH29]
MSSTTRKPGNIGFAGQIHEDETGVQMLGNGYRAYSPALMRFTAPDNLSPFKQGGINAYGYCMGDPVNNHDPSGHITFRALAHTVLNVIRLRNSALIGASRLERLPFVAMREVVRYLPGHAAVDLASTSTTMNFRVNSATYRIGKMDIGRLPGAQIGFSTYLARGTGVAQVNARRRIELGIQEGVLPGQIRAELPNSQLGMQHNTGMSQKALQTDLQAALGPYYQSPEITAQRRGKMFPLSRAASTVYAGVQRLTEDLHYPLRLRQQALLIRQGDRRALWNFRKRFIS